MNSVNVMISVFLCLSAGLVVIRGENCTQSITGCKCLVSDLSITCSLGATDVSLNTSFLSITQKRVVDTFHISDNNNITKLSNYFSRNVSFVNINIRNAKSLMSIEEKAFWSSVNTTKTFRLTTTSVNSSDSLFKAISQLVYLSELVLDDNRIDTVPDHAFGEQRYLTMVSMTRNRIKYLGKFAFNRLYNLNYLDLSENLLQELKNNSLTIKNASGKDTFPVHIRINVRMNQISHISDHAFDDLKRPTNIDISFNNMTELSPNVFKTILSYESSKIIVKGNKVKCDCGIYWIFKDKKINPMFNGPLRCADKRYFENLTNKDFKNCTSYYYDD